METTSRTQTGRGRARLARVARIATAVALVSAGFTIAISSAVGASTTTANPLANPAPVTADEATQETQFDDDINNERAARGIPTMEPSSYLNALAQAYVDYEVSLTGPPYASASPNMQFSDVGPTFSENWIAANPCTAAQYGACPYSVYEGVQNGVPTRFTNLGSVEGSDTPSGANTGLIVQALMESQAYRNIVLAPGWTMIGTAAVCSSVGWMLEALVGSPATVTPAIPNTPEDPIVTSPTSGINPCTPSTPAPTQDNFTVPNPVVDMASTPSGNGYWVVDAQGYVAAYGDAVNYGGMGGYPLNAPISHIVSTPDGLGYWLVASDGGIFSFGDAQFYGSLGGDPPSTPVVGMAVDDATGGYWIVDQAGQVFNYNAPVYGLSA